jgi:hypothetical protein
MAYVNYRANEARAFAERIKAMGFAVYLAHNGEYGFITDETETRVLCFGTDNHLSGCYGPPSPESGTSWRMDKSPSDLENKDDVRAALYAHPPAWAGNGWKKMTTVAEYLKSYQSSSKYERV